MSGRRARRPHASQGGVGTVWAVWAMVLVASVAVLAMVVAMAAARQHRLDSAADLAALSAADGLQRGASACSAAARVAEANDVRLAGCRIDGADVLVTVEDRLRLPLGLDEQLVSYARAGPAASSDGDHRSPP